MIYQHNMLDTEYNGWTNYSTWNAALWVDNEEYAYFTRIDEQKRIVEWNSELVEQFIRDMFPDGTPDMQMREEDGCKLHTLDHVNYGEIADAWNDEEFSE